MTFCQPPYQKKRPFISDSKASLKVLYKIKLVLTNNPPFSYIGGKGIKMYNEEEVLIHSGAILKIKNFNVIKNKGHHLKLIAKSFQEDGEDFFNPLCWENKEKLKNLT